MTTKDIANQVLNDHYRSYSLIFEYLTRDDTFPYIVLPPKVSSTFHSSLSAESLLEFCKEETSSPLLSQPLHVPHKPAEPNLQEVPRYHWEYVKESFLKCNWYLIRWWFILFVLVGIIGLATNGLHGFLVCSLYLLLFLPALFVVAYSSWRKKECVLKQIPFTEEQIDVLKRKEEERYYRALQDYPELQKQFEEDYNKAVELAKKKRDIIESCCWQYLSNALKNSFLQSEDYLQVDDSSQKGRSEDKLFSALMHTIPDAVHVDTVINGYYPDIMVSTANHVYFDIEIDEPYDAIAKKEIHYIGGEDENRNIRITDKNWVVIRFSEKQVMTDCESCVKVITCLMDLVEKGNYEAFVEMLRIPDSFIEKRWRKEDARMMALENYRNTY